MVILGDIFEILWHPFYLLEFDLRTLNQQKNLKFCHFSDTAPSKTENDPKFTIFKKNQVYGNMVKFQHTFYANSHFVIVCCLLDSQKQLLANHLHYET